MDFTKKTASCPNRSLPRAPNRADARSIPIIALTAGAFHEDAQRGMRAGLNAHLSKSMQPGLPFETLERLIKA